MNSSDAAPPDPAALEFSRLLGPLRRAVLRASRSAADLPDLPEAQIELLRVLADGPLAPREAAARLRVAASTVSNLVKAMRAAGLVERTADPHDARTVLLTATRAAHDLLGRYDRASARVLARTLDGLPPADREAFHAALPALARLTDRLEGN
ncbi:MarR family winged helix-turn-helix transcriptional regulator [Streptomyces axinellae]|uniref:MarR family transcriptional regulator n=1 Tax=Streptomyces axinellae TaxID=552788 RepID=A0ABP6CG26_9ACTN